MAATSEDAIGIKKALDYDGLHKQYCELQQSFKTISEEKSNLQIVVDKANIEIEALKSSKDATERSKKEAEETLKELEKNENRLRALYTETLEQLNEKRVAYEEAKSELPALRQKVIILSSEVELATANVFNLKNIKNNLENELSSINTRKSQIEDNLKSFQKDYDNYRDSSSLERSKLKEHIADLRREKENASDVADQLRLQLDHAKQNIHIAEEKLNANIRENEQLKLRLGSASKTYQDLSVLYEEHVAVSEKKISALDNKIKSITEEKTTLLEKTSELERQLKDEKTLRQEYYNQISRIDQPCEEGDASQLLSLIKDYQNANKRPEDIFQDYFELRTKYDSVVTEYANCDKLAQMLSRKLTDKELLSSRLQTELTESTLKIKELNKSLSVKETEYNALEISNTDLADKVCDLTREKKALKATLEDTTYQLRYLVSDMQRRDEPIPSNLVTSSKFLTATELSPSLPHDKLIFKNVTELQELNSKLISEVSSLTEQLQSTTNEYSNANAERENNLQLYKTSIDEATQTISDLKNKSNDLQKQVNMLTTECNNYKKFVSEFGEGDAKGKFDQMTQNQIRQREELDIIFENYREETLNEINKLKEDLEIARQSAIEARSLYTKANVDIAHLNRKQINLTTSVEQRDEELKIARRQNSILQERITSREREVSEAKSELADIKSRAEILSNENISLTHRIEGITTAYNIMKETASKDSAEKASFSSLVKSMNDRLESFTNNSIKNSEQLKDNNDKLNRELQHARDTIAAFEKELESYKSIDQQEIKDKYKESVVEIRLLKTRISEAEQQLSNVNQERIIAQTKLAAVEEQLKSATSLSQSSSGDGSSNTNGLDSNACNDHIRLLAEAEDRIRQLESDIERYQSAIAESDKKANTLVKEHQEFVVQSEASISKLIKDLESKSAAVSAVQAEGEKHILELKALHEKALASRNETISEKQALEEKLKTLNEENNSKNAEIQTLRDLVEEKTTSCNEAETKLNVETKANLEYRETINVLRADVSNLTFEISEYKSNADAAKATMESMKSDFNNTASTWNEYKESLKKSLAESEKQREKLIERVDQLVQQHAEWKAAIVQDTGVDDSTFEGITNDILQQLREANETLRIERDANEERYRHEQEKLKLVEAEIIPLKAQVDFLRADCDRLREESSKMNEKGNEEAESYRMQCDAFKIQNRALIQENERLRERRELAQAELDKKNEELNPLILKVNQLEAELKQSQEEVSVLTKSQKEWTARSAQLLSKYNRVDPAESDRIKSELEDTKKELESAKAKITELESTIEGLTTKLNTAETDRAAHISKISERGRLLLDFKRRYTDAEKRCAEAEKKLEEAENKLATSVNANQNNANTKLLKEKEAAELAVKTLEEEKEKAEKAKIEAELEQKKAEDALTVRMNEFTTLEKKYNGMLQRARVINQEKNKLTEELRTLRESEGDKSEVDALKLKISELESELEASRKDLQEKSVELTRLKAQNSMALNKSNRLQKELEALKANKATTSTLNAQAPAFQVSTPTNPSSPIVANISPSKTTSNLKLKDKEPDAMTSSVNTPDLSATPVPASVDTPILTPPPITTPPSTSIAEPEEINASAPINSTDDEPIDANEAEDINTSVTEQASTSTPEVDTGLFMEGDNTDNQANQNTLNDNNIADGETVDDTKADISEDPVNEVPVDVEVHEVPTTEKSDSLQLDDAIEVTSKEISLNGETNESPVALKEDIGMEEKNTLEPTDVADETNEGAVEPVIGTKRKDRSEEADTTDDATPESPSKKPHTTHEEASSI